MAVTKSPGVYVFEVPSANAPIAGVGTSTPLFIGAVPDTITMPPVATPPNQATVSAPVGKPVLVTNLTEFKDAFGDFSLDAGQSTLAHAVNGYYANGGTRCYVMRLLPSFTPTDLEDALAATEAITEISLVAAPGLTGDSYYDAIIGHCAVQTQSRFAILDTTATAGDDLTKLDYATAGHILPDKSDYAALYFPWIQVFDPATKGSVYVPPSGHMAGLYARVDANRGVHKAPANEVVFGATGLKTRISKNQQDGLNLQGVNCIRSLNGNIRVWGARTLGGDDNLEFKYLSARRLFILLRESIERGLQWAVFEPNNADLWAKITRSVSAFLRNVWSSGALFGASPEEAFFVKCNAETNPPSVRDAGQVVTEIGVALTKPAEFVIFKLGMKADES
ncbi:MAG: phage tail sheath subtilisin-like domain-containing protein [Minicystis sp.]